MALQDLPRKEQGRPVPKKPYEPPEVTCVRVQLEERILGCLFKTIQVCGLTE